MRLITIISCAFFLGAASCRNPHTRPPVEVVDVVADDGAGGADEAPPEIIEDILENFERVHFEFDSARMAGESRSALSRNAALLRSYGAIRVEVQGHADARGTTDYNLALGDSRAQAIKDHLVNVGVAPSRVKTISFGEERPLAPGDDDGAWSKNRRAEFRVLEGDQVEGTVN